MTFEAAARISFQGNIVGQAGMTSRLPGWGPDTPRLVLATTHSFILLAGVETELEEFSLHGNA